MDRRKEWRAAERLLKQGNVEAALKELRKVAGGTVADVVTLNRLGDLLARQGKRAEAISYYTKIAMQFEKGGFAPKAIAIHKKILRLDSEHLESALRLGDLYSRQKMHGEARKYLLHAANRHLERDELDKAREVFEQLVEAEPTELRHRVRLAETKAAAGESSEAAAELVWVGDGLLSQNEVPEAEKVYARAHELDPEAHGPQTGLARCRAAAGETGAALEALEGIVGSGASDPSSVAELARMYDVAGRADDAERTLALVAPLEIPDDAWERLATTAVKIGNVDRLWKRIDGMLEAPVPEENRTRLAELLERLGMLEEDGHIPALQRWVNLEEASGHIQPTVRALDALSQAYQARSLVDEAAEVKARMQRVAPPDEEPSVGAVAESTETEPVIEPTSLVSAAPPPPPEPKPQLQPAARSAAPAAVSDDEGGEPTPPAVPQDRTDEEFVAGRVTQAEVLEKYDLLQQALEQLQEVVDKFPGHVAAQEQRVSLVRCLDDPGDLPQVLTDLAVARWAAGDHAGAREAAREAEKLTGLAARSRRTLERWELIEPTEPPAAAAPPPVATSAVKGDEVVIDLEGDDDFEETVEVIESAPAAAAADEGNDDLRAIKAALEQEWPDEGDAVVPIVPEESPDQSMGEILQAFRERVDEELAADDHRTHYDLGIGFKEMGLVDEAIEEFRKAAEATVLHREACAMLAACHRDRQESAEAVKWYREALDGEDVNSELSRNLRYDLAEALLESGDAIEALRQFRDVLEVDPSFRDVQGRVSELENSLQS